LRRQQRKSESENSSTSGWLTTFNDLVTLLMVFFVLMFSMSSINTDKIKEFQYALQSGLGILREGQRVSVSVKEPQPIDDMSHINTQPEEKKAQDKNQVIGTLTADVLKDLESDLGIQVTLSHRGARLSFEDRVLFDFGKAGIHPEGFSFLDKIATVLKKGPHAVRVEGHTDNVPIQTKRFPSNWELSVARAVNVVKYFAEVSNINPHRLSAVGYGESRPVVPNDAPQNRAKNRRVEILLISEDKEENVK
jgi:chemotaxis protein MotB